MKRLLGSGEGRSILVFLLCVGALGAVALATAHPTAAPAARSPVTAAPTASAATSPLGLTVDSPVPSYDDTATPTIGDVGPGWSDLAGLLLKLGLVLALLILALRGLQRLSGRKGRPLGRPPAIEVLDTVPLAQGASLFLVSVGQRALLLGGTAQQVSLLTEVDDPDLIARLRPSQPRSSLPDFLSLLGDARSASK